MSKYVYIYKVDESIDIKGFLNGLFATETQSGPRV